MDMFSLLSCRCKHRDRSPQHSEAPEVVKGNPSEAEPLLENNVAKQGGSSSSKKKIEDKICPITGAVGYCPMARPPPGTKLPDGPKPELRVLMFLLWEDDDGSKVSVGIYPHQNKHWQALDLPDTSSKEEIKAKFHKLSIKYHPDKNKEEGAKERFQEITEAYQALRDVDGTLAFPWDKYPDRQHTMTGEEVLRTFAPLGREAAAQDPIKAQMMQHVVKESTDCKVIMYEKEIVDGEVRTKEIWADGLCEDKRNGSNHLVKVYRREVSID